MVSRFASLTCCFKHFFYMLGPKPPATFCGYLDNNIPKVYISERPSVWIKFVTHQPGNRFSLHYIRGIIVKPQEVYDNHVRKNWHTMQCKNREATWLYAELLSSLLMTRQCTVICGLISQNSIQKSCNLFQPFKTLETSDLARFYETS